MADQPTSDGVELEQPDTVAVEPERDVPSSSETSGTFPADDVAGDGPSTFGLDDDVPSSHDTCGTFPAQEVAETFPGDFTDPQASEATDKAGEG